MKFNKLPLFLGVILMLYGFSKIDSTPKFISIGDLTKSQILKTKVTGLGGFQQNCIKMEIDNLTDTTQLILLEPGRRLVSVDSHFQDIFIVKEQRFLLAPNQSTTISAYGFCCQSGNSSPKKDSKFTLGYMAQKKWIELAEFIDQNNFPRSAIQAAVWAISNGHQTASITATDRQAIRALRETVATLKNEPIPWYYLTYEKDTSLVFSNKPEHLSGSFNYQLTSNTVVTINITNEKGKLMKVMTSDMPKQKGKYELLLNTSVKGWEKGAYFVRLYEGSHTLNKKMAFKL